ncbi:Vps62-related protein [Spartinivicinus poritis]|uniref:Vps62-related protein n=1 Tax=Spartinivicinus poritis TaxID=2994640 RepID=A0ABT5UE93_9GAMM|nr:Vps62-related protein [Spartinivicinus sp. A2-2]MDE1464326.1 Vps62-related protein [Spartinivicinus sp. A2-2]
MKKIITITTFVALAATTTGVAANTTKDSLAIKYVNQFDLVWWDKKSGGKYNGSYYRPKLPTGYYRLGHYAKAGYSAPTESVAVVKEVKPGSLAKPVGYTRVWKDSGSGAKWNGSFWQPNPPTGYKCLGVVAQRGYHEPSIDEIRCVKSNLVVSAKAGQVTWTDKGTGANKKFGSWKIVPNHPDGLDMNLFVARSSRTAPSSSLLFNVLNKNAVVDQKLTKSEILALIKKHGPILYLHPKEKYKLDSPFYYMNNAWLVNEKGSKIQTSLASFEDDYNYIKSADNISGSSANSIWLKPNNLSALKSGNIGRAKSVVHIKNVLPGYTDIQFWFFYSYNGPGTAKVRLGEIYSHAGELKPFGEHTADWEHVTLRFDNSSKKVTSVYFAQHNYGEVKLANQVDWDNNHLVIYSSKNGHASYSGKGKNSHRVLHKCTGRILGQCTGHLDVDLLNYTDKGSRFNSYEKGNFYVVNYEQAGWAELKFRWGPQKEARMSVNQARKVAVDFFGPFIGNSLAGLIGSSLFSYFYSEDQNAPSNIGTKSSWNENEF